MSESCITELPILSREPTHFIDVYPELVIQHDVSTQADMFLAYSSPKEPCTPLMEDNSAVSFTDNTYVNIILLLLWLHYIHLYKLQEEYHPTGDTTQTEEEEQVEGALQKEKKFIVFESCLLKLLE